MNFEFSEEQTMIKDSVSRFVREQYDFDTRRGIIESDDGISRDFWSMFAELGWLSVPFAEEYGGFGGTVIDIAAVMEEMGKGIVLSPMCPPSSCLVVYCLHLLIQPLKKRLFQASLRVHAWVPLPTWSLSHATK